jgi:hypothetical protein
MRIPKIAETFRTRQWKCDLWDREMKETAANLIYTVHWTLCSQDHQMQLAKQRNHDVFAHRILHLLNC